MSNNEDMRVIAVGDDDQNIFEFRGSDSGYMFRMSREPGSRFMEMTENYRSCVHPVRFANSFVRCISNRMKTKPIVSKREENGWVEVTRHTSDCMYQPLVEKLLQNRVGGTSCVLTQTNEESVIVTALLRRYGINAKLIQSMDSFAFCNMAEVRYLTRYMSKRIKTPLIPEGLWHEAKQATFAAYGGSQSLTYVRRCMELFEQTNRDKYFNDFKEFVMESSLEDFCDLSGAEVVVSTIHKSKGREFDDVYMLVSGGYAEDDSLMRRCYVGITRARNRLYIHTKCDFFNCPGVDKYSVDEKKYPMPEEIVLQLSHKDVYLDYFRGIKRDVLSLKSGDPLIYRDFALYETVDNKPVGRLSQKNAMYVDEMEREGI